MNDYNKTTVSKISEFSNKKVLIKGWLQGKRGSGKLHFLQVRDGTGTIQAVVFKGDVAEEVFTLAGSLTQESSIKIYGTVKEDKRSKIGYEIGVDNVELVNESVDYPISPKEHGVDFLMKNRHLWLRSSRQRAVMKIRHTIINSIREFFNERDFMLVDAPIFTPSACEGTSNLFETEYFDTKAYLTQSGQLYMEAAAMAFGKVYCLGPTFRAEKSKTRRHLTEFWMVEPEMAYCTLEEDMQVAENLVKHILKTVLEKCKFELDELERDTSKLEAMAEKNFHRITYDKALEICNKKGKPVVWGEDLGGDEETCISEEFDTPVMITHYPKKCKAFYMKEDANNPEVVLCVDMIAPEGYGEIIGGSEREDDLDKLLEKIKEHNIPEEAMQWFIDLRKYGSVPHAGFGLGIERTVAWICGLHHVRETIPFPRLMDRMYP